MSDSLHQCAANRLAECGDHRIALNPIQCIHPDLNQFMVRQGQIDLVNNTLCQPTPTDDHQRFAVVRQLAQVSLLFVVQFFHRLVLSQVVLKFGANIARQTVGCNDIFPFRSLFGWFRCLPNSMKTVRIKYLELGEVIGLCLKL